MRCPTLAELPPPPAGKCGWPWTLESPQLPDATLDGHPWPRISIVTPSFNQAEFLEETIRSVLLQGYPNLEYIIKDGGSTDGAIDTIRKYAPWLTHWETGPDGGQVNAINSSLALTSGVILNWLNSDDYLLPCALETIAQVFSSDKKLDLYIASNISVWKDDRNNHAYRMIAFTPTIRDWVYVRYGLTGVAQDACFFSKQIWLDSGPLDNRYDFSFDSDFYAKAQLGARHIALGSQLVSVMNRHDRQKTHVNFHSLKGEEIRNPQLSALKSVLRRSLRSRVGPLLCELLKVFMNRHRAGIFSVQHKDGVGFEVR